MPRIFEVEQQTRASGAGLGPGPTTNLSGVYALGNATNELVARRQQEAERDAALWATTKLSEAQSTWAQTLRERQSQAADGAPEFAIGIDKDFETYAQELSGQAPTRASRDFMRERLAAFRAGLVGRAQEFEASERAAYTVRQSEQSIDVGATLAFQMPEAFPDLLAERVALFDSQRLQPEQRRALVDAARYTMARNAVLGMSESDPQGTLELLETPAGTSGVASVEALASDDRLRIISDLRARAASSLVEQRQAMTDRLRDIGAAAAAGVPIPSVPSERELKALYGEHEGAQRYTAAVNAQQLSGTVAAMHTLSSSDLVAQAAAAAPQQVQGAADQSQTHAFLMNRTQAILAERDRDPAGYLVQHSPAVREEWAALTADPSTSPDAYLSAVRAERERLGLPGTDVVPAAYAAQIAETVNTSTAENLATTFETLAAQWGSAWPDLYAQIADDVPGTALVIGAGIPRAAATALAATARLKDAELKAMLPPSTTWADLENEVNASFVDFQSSMPVEAVRTTAAVKDAAVRLALKYMNDGAGMGDAVEKAHRDLVDSQYELVELRGATIRVPVGVNADQVEQVADDRLRRLELPQSALVVPEGGALTAEDYQARYGEYVRDNGYWLTNPSSTGIRLYVDGGPVAGPIEMTWDELMAPGIAEDAARAERQRRSATATTDLDELNLRQ
jgi:hypothetical protein